MSFSNIQNMIRTSDCKIANNIYIESQRLHPLFDSVSEETEAFFDRKQESYALTDKQLIMEIIDVSLCISNQMKELSNSFRKDYNFSRFGPLIKRSIAYIGKNAFQIARDLYNVYYICEYFDFDSLNYENIVYQIRYEIEEDRFLQNKLTIKDFLNWFHGEGEVYAAVWLDRIDKELKVKIRIKELNRNTLIKAWELHDSQPKNQERKIL